MNTEDRVRAAVGQLADAAPTPPSWESLKSRLRHSPTRRAPARGLVGGRRPARARLGTALVALLGVALVALPALAAVREVSSWLAGAKDPDAPVPLAPDVFIASGVAGAAWEIVATPSDQGPCVLVRVGQAGLGGCGPSDVRGDPTAQGATHSVQGGNGSGGLAALNASIVHGWAAADVASVELVLMEGSSATTQLMITPPEVGGPPKLFWAVLPCDASQCVDRGPLVRALVARDASGNVLETRDVHDPKAGNDAAGRERGARPEG